MKKQNSKFEPQYTFIGNIDSFASRLEENISEIASNVGWSPVKEVLLASKIKLENEFLISLNVVHQDRIRTVLIVQISNDGTPLEAIELAGQEIVKQLTETEPDSTPSRFVVVSPAISEKVVKMAQKRNIPLSFLMIDNDCCTYWPVTSQDS
jgi:hypothetical protein